MARELGIAERRLLGWEPREWHTYEYDEQGRVARVTVAREPEFDDRQRDRLLALEIYEAGICSCGVHVSLSSDRSNVFAIEERLCLVCKERTKYGRVQHERDEAAVARFGDKIPAATARPGDGRHTYVRPLGPLEAAARQAEATAAARPMRG